MAMASSVSFYGKSIPGTVGFLFRGSVFMPVRGDSLFLVLICLAGYILLRICLIEGNEVPNVITKGWDCVLRAYMLKVG